jgi:hypothetical protein
VGSSVFIDIAVPLIITAYQPSRRFGATPQIDEVLPITNL